MKLPEEKEVTTEIKTELQSAPVEVEAEANEVKSTKVTAEVHTTASSQIERSESSQIELPVVESIHDSDEEIELTESEKNPESESVKVEGRG